MGERPGAGIRLADARFLLPLADGRVCILGEVGRWPRVLTEMGWTAVAGEEAADVVVTDPVHLARAVGSPAPCVVLVGRGRPDGGWAGRTPVRYLERPGPHGPSMFVPLDQRAAVRYVWRRWSIPRWRRQRVRNQLVPLAAGALAARSRLTVASSGARPPFLLEAAAAHGTPRDCSWFLALGTGDDLQRAAFHVLAPGADVPSWVVKFSRVPGAGEPFERDRGGLELLARHAPDAARSVPRVVGPVAVGRLVGAVEEAAPGGQLGAYLLSRGPRRPRLAAVDRVAAWLVDLAVESRTEPAALQPELDRLDAQVVPRWQHLGVGPGLAASVPPVPGVLVHGDPGPWNVVHDGRREAVLDWESARHPGLPLWDLVYFLTDALVSVDGADAEDDKLQHALRLLRGDHRRSPRLFGWVRTMVDALGLPPAAVGPVVTLCWLHHGLSPQTRRARLGPGAPAADVAHLGRLAGPWMADDALGTGWARWRDG